jgi:hypothetical protein
MAFPKNLDSNILREFVAEFPFLGDKVQERNKLRTVQMSQILNELSLCASAGQRSDGEKDTRLLAVIHRPLTLLDVKMR